jgi:four helix bundle protein
VDKAELIGRTKRFALQILKFVERLPKTIGGRVIANQPIRSATSIATNYRSACRARSRAEFAAKLGTVAEEADEIVYWLELIRELELLGDAQFEPLLAEANELTAIFTSARRTSTQNQTSKIKHRT